jgi:hypothetical protein
MLATTQVAVDEGRAAGETMNALDQRSWAIRAGVLAALGRPGTLYRVAVVPLWADLYRVNVLTGEGPTSVRIPHSYFVAADGCGNILRSTPGIRREY